MSTTRAVRLFYLVVLGTALGGSTGAAAGWLHVHWWIAIGPVAAIELGGVVLSMYADDRLQLGESAIVARLLSAAVALGAVATNVLGHHHVGQAAFFGGMSALGYAVYLLMSAAKRRDALRAAGKLEDTAPLYGWWQWLRHPGLTARARRLAILDPTLGPYRSLDAARERVRAERREAAIARELGGVIRRSAGRTVAAIAVHTYDLAEVARRIAQRADYDAITDLFAADLTPAKLTGKTGPVAAPAPAGGDDLTALVDATAPTIAEQIEAAIGRHLPAVPEQVTPTVHRPRLRPVGLRRPRRMGRAAPAINVTVVAPPKPERAANPAPEGGRPKPATKAAKTPASTADRVAALLRQKPAMTQADVAARLQLGERTVRRYWPAKQPAVINGHNHAGED